VGRPALFATTRQFLDDLGLASLDQLPPTDNPAAQAGALRMLDKTGDDMMQPILPMEGDLLGEAATPAEGVPVEADLDEAAAPDATGPDAIIPEEAARDEAGPVQDPSEPDNNVETVASPLDGKQP
jgi:segregation and condensation protein B